VTKKKTRWATHIYLSLLLPTVQILQSSVASLNLKKHWEDEIKATSFVYRTGTFYYEVFANYGFKLNLHSLEEVTDLKKIKVYKGTKPGTEIIWDEGTIYNDGDTFYINSDEYIKWYPVDCTLGGHVLTAKFDGNDSKMFDYDGTKF